MPLRFFKLCFLVEHVVAIVIICMLFSVPLCSVAQTSDTLTTVKQLIDTKKLIKAEKLLKSYANSRPQDLNTQWLYAQTAFTNKHFKKSKAIYEATIAAHPQNKILQLDYANKLADMGEGEKAIPLYKSYLQFDSTATDINLSLAKISYWQADYKEAMALVKKAMSNRAKGATASELQNEILLAKSPWLKISALGSVDDQPLQQFTPIIQAGVALHPFANLQFSLSTPLFISNQKVFNVQQATLADLLYFKKAKLSLRLEGGFIKLPTNKVSGIANFELSKIVAKRLALGIQVEHQPYLFNKANTLNPLMQMHYGFSAAWQNPNSWQGRAAFDLNQFYTDKNYIYNASAWFLSPPLKFSVLDFRFGYAYSFSTSTHNKFESTKSLSEILSTWTSTTNISGVYNPYFTPYLQSVNSALVAIHIQPIKMIDIGLKASVCFYGTTQNPYLYLNKDASNQTVIERSYAKVLFFPVDINTYIGAQLSPKMYLKAAYSYLRNNFYSSHQFGLSFKISFWNERKG